MLPCAPFAPDSTAAVHVNVGAPQMQHFNHFLQQEVPNAPKRRRVENAAGGCMTLPATTSISGGMRIGKGHTTSSVQVKAGGRTKSQLQADRRRERNRILARRTRLRKKFFFESLQKDVMDLQRENEMLKSVVKENIDGDDGKKILDSCDAAERIPPGVLEACSEGGMDFDSQDFNLVKSIQASQQSFIITDPSLLDNPIVFASDGFMEVTGYSREQVLGRNCRFLQGTDTSQESVDEVRQALSQGNDVSVTLINYMADGTPFWNKLFIAALRDAHNNIVNFIGVIVKVATPEPGHPEHGKLLEDVEIDKDGDDKAAEMNFADYED